MGFFSKIANFFSMFNPSKNSRTSSSEDDDQKRKLLFDNLLAEFQLGSSTEGIDAIYDQLMKERKRQAIDKIDKHHGIKAQAVHDFTDFHSRSSSFDEDDQKRKLLFDNLLAKFQLGSSTEGIDAILGLSRISLSPWELNALYDQLIEERKHLTIDKIDKLDENQKRKLLFDNLLAEFQLGFSTEWTDALYDQFMEERKRNGSLRKR